MMIHATLMLVMLAGLGADTKREAECERLCAEAEAMSGGETYRTRGTEVSLLGWSAIRKSLELVEYQEAKLNSTALQLSARRSAGITDEWLKELEESGLSGLEKSRQLRRREIHASMKAYEVAQEVLLPHQSARLRECRQWYAFHRDPINALSSEIDLSQGTAEKIAAIIDERDEEFSPAYIRYTESRKAHWAKSLTPAELKAESTMPTTKAEKRAHDAALKKKISVGKELRDKFHKIYDAKWAAYGRMMWMSLNKEERKAWFEKAGDPVYLPFDGYRYAYLLRKDERRARISGSL